MPAGKGQRVSGPDHRRPPQPESPAEPPVEPPVEPGQLRFLRILVTVLTATMILGVGAIVVLLALRLTAAPPPLALPETIALPEGAEALAVTAAPGWYAVVTRDGRILIFDRTTGALRQEIAVE